MRPSEAPQLELSDLSNYQTMLGPGRILMTRSAQHAGTAVTDDGTTRHPEGWSTAAATRSVRVPILLEIVEQRRHHIERGGVADDERLFRSRGGGYVHESAYGLPWPAARRVIPTPSQVASPWRPGRTICDTRA